MNTKLLTLSLLLCCACRSSGKAPPLHEGGQVHREYVACDTALDLAASVTADLEREGPRTAYEKLDEFKKWKIVNGHAMHAHLMFDAAHPVLLFQHYNGERFMTAVAECGRVLEGKAGQELARMNKAFASGDLGAIEKAFGDERSVIGKDTVAQSSELVPYAQFFQGALFNEQLARANAHDAAAAQRIVELMDQAGAAFARRGAHEPYFHTLVVSAQALEAAGSADLAAERWLRAVDSKYWPQASSEVQQMIGAHVTSYRSRVERELKDDFERKFAAEAQRIATDFDERLAKALSTAEQNQRGALDGAQAQSATERSELEKRLKDEHQAALTELERRLQDEHRAQMAALDADFRARNAEAVGRIEALTFALQTANRPAAGNTDAANQARPAEQSTPVGPAPAVAPASESAPPQKVPPPNAAPPSDAAQAPGTRHD